MQITTIGLDIAKNVFQVHENHLGKAFMKMNFSGPQFQFIPAPPIPTPPPAAESPLPAPPATPPEAALQASPPAVSEQTAEKRRKSPAQSRTRRRPG